MKVGFCGERADPFTARRSDAKTKTKGLCRMDARINYQLLCDNEIRAADAMENAPTLLLQVCCAPCGSYVIDYLARHFNVTILYYNPNIWPREEYDKRLYELRRMLPMMETKYPVSVMECEYDDSAFYEAAKGLEDAPEGGARCTKCFELRMGRTALLAKERGFDWFTTTLSVSPHKNAQLLNRIGERLSEETGVKYLHADFKKREGYKRSIELSGKYGLYRQNYCGCRFSYREDGK